MKKTKRDILNMTSNKETGFYIPNKIKKEKKINNKNQWIYDSFETLVQEVICMNKESIENTIKK